MGVLVKILKVILRFAPLAAFGAIAFTIGRFGPASAAPLLKFVALIYLASAVFVLLILVPFARASGAPLWRLIVHLKDALLLVTFTGSSVSALLGLIEKMLTLGCDRQLTRLVLISGYSFSLSGSNIYLITAGGDVGDRADRKRTVDAVLIALVTSLGSSSMAGSAFLNLIATL